MATDPVNLACRFSPRSNNYTLKPGEEELRVLIATDVMAEGQNLQDCAIVVNYDLPWAIVRLIQRAGRVDRIGQQNDTIRIYSFPPRGVETGHPPAPAADEAPGAEPGGRWHG